jgi:hypothetical protein
MQEALGKIHLKNIARMNILDGALNRPSIGMGGKIARERFAMRDAKLWCQIVKFNWWQRLSARCRVIDRTGEQARPKLGYPRSGPVAARVRIRFREALRNKPRRLSLVVERHDDVIQPDGQGRHLKFVQRGSRNSLQAASQFIAKQAGISSLKWRKVGSRVARELGKPTCQSTQGVAAVCRNCEPIDRVGGDKRVPAERRMRHGAVEVDDMWHRRQTAKRFDRLEPGIQALDQWKFVVVSGAVSHAETSFRKDAGNTLFSSVKCTLTVLA